MFPQKSSYLCQSRVIAGFGAWAEWVNIEFHCSELIEDKRPAVQAGSILLKNRRAFAGELDGYKYNSKDRQQDYYRWQCNKNIKNAFKESIHNRLQLVLYYRYLVC